jgi:hypothetical protein
MPFVYNPDALGNLERAIARDRLAPYLADSKGDLGQAILMYELNTLFCQGLYGVLQPLEIIFRNSLHRTISVGTGKSNWYDFSLLRTREYESVKEAKANILRRSAAITPGRVVAELTFGFWTRLVSAEYEKTLWVPHLHKAFPCLRKPDRASDLPPIFSPRIMRLSPGLTSLTQPL